jgi:DNA ligase-1
MSRLPILYTIDKKGKTRQWSVSFDANTITREYGEKGGAMQTANRSFEGKNVGRKNATTGEQQARQEAIKEWIDHIDDGYKFENGEGTKLLELVLKFKSDGGANTGVARAVREALETPETENVSETNASVSESCTTKCLPMHCTTYTEEEKVLKYLDFNRGVFVQPKIDGVRALASFNPATKTVRLTSRQGKDIVHLEHIKQHLLKHFFIANPDLVLDGELYTHKLKDVNGNEIEDATERFNIISGACRPVRKTPHELEAQIQYHVFDVASSGDIQINRFKVLDGLNFGGDDGIVVKVNYKIAKTKADIVKFHDEYFAEGYEGVVIRAYDLLYEHDHRSMKLRKYKYFSDAEYDIVSAECDSGVDTEFFTWVCKTPYNGEIFNVKPQGTRDSRRKMYADYLSNPQFFVGKKLTVKFQSVSETGVPRFPVAISVRDYE